VKPGEIWGYTHPQSGKKVGVKVAFVFPPMGESKRHIAECVNMKGTEIYTFILTPEGAPMLKDGTASPNWKLIEEAP
jgi:hypothetical protein